LATNAGNPGIFLRRTCLRAFCGSSREETMTGTMAAVGIAIGGTSLICYLLLSRPQHRRADRGSSGDSSGADGGSYPGSDGWSLFGWIGGGDSGSDNSSSSSDSGGGDSGGGGDRGGGGD
jgi:hypothetical protein